MTDDADKTELETQIAALQKRLSDLERAKPPPPSEADVAKFRDEMHQMRERNASAIPPWMHEACAGGVSDADAAGIRGTARAPTGLPGMIPQAQPTGGGSPANVPGSGTGWSREIPLGPSMHQRYVDQQIDAQDRKDRQQFVQQAAQVEASRKFAEQSAKLDQLIEQNKKLMEKIK